MMWKAWNMTFFTSSSGILVISVTCSLHVRVREKGCIYLLRPLHCPKQISLRETKPSLERCFSDFLGATGAFQSCPKPWLSQACCGGTYEMPRSRSKVPWSTQCTENQLWWTVKHMSTVLLWTSYGCQCNICRVNPRVTNQRMTSIKLVLWICICYNTILRWPSRLSLILAVPKTLHSKAIYLLSIMNLFFRPSHL